MRYFGIDKYTRMQSSLPLNFSRGFLFYIIHRRSETLARDEALKLSTLGTILAWQWTEIGSLSRVDDIWCFQLQSSTRDRWYLRLIYVPIHLKAYDPKGETSNLLVMIAQTFSRIQRFMWDDNLSCTNCRTSKYSTNFTICHSFQERKTDGYRNIVG